MDRKRAKKIRNARVIMTNIFMGLSVIAIVFVLMLAAMGFSFNENGSLEQSGLLQISSHPSGAVVEIDGKVQFSHTTINKMLSSGEHHIKISKDGYDTWEKDVRIDSGLLTNINWVRLFPTNPTTQKIDTFDELRLVSFSSDRKSLLIGEKESVTLTLMNIQDEKTPIKKVEIAKLLNIGSKETARNANLQIISWNESGDKVILTWTDSDNNVYWYLGDLGKPENSINLTAQFGYTFTTILAANDSASKLWAVENGNLHLIDLGNLTIHKTIISGIEKITNNNDAVIFIGTDATTGIRSISIFREGETGSSIVKDLTGISTSNITISTGSYWGEDWVAYSLDKTINLLGGKYPSFDKPAKNPLKSILKRDLEYAPTTLLRDDEQHIAVFSDGTNRTAFDFETKDYFDSNTASAVEANWLDNYILWYVESNKLFVQDFDGNNIRELIDNVSSQLPVCLSENNRWLYYFDTIETLTETEETAAETGTKTITQYVLRRKKLEI